MCIYIYMYIYIYIYILYCGQSPRESRGRRGGARAEVYGDVRSCRLSYSLCSGFLIYDNIVKSLIQNIKCKEQYNILNANK